MMIERVIKEAEIVRKWAEDLIDEGYYDFPTDLCGMCAIASGELSKRLTTINIPHKIAINSNHTFIIYEGYVIDITATQFDIEESVWVVPLKEAKKHKGGWWRVQKIVLDVKDLIRYQKRVGWADDQIAFV